MTNERRSYNGIQIVILYIFHSMFCFYAFEQTISIALSYGNDFVASRSNVPLQTATEFNDKEAHKSFSCNIDIYVFPRIQRKCSDCGQPTIHRNLFQPNDFKWNAHHIFQTQNVSNNTRTSMTNNRWSIVSRGRCLAMRIV